MLKKDLGLFILILVVAAVVAFLNPREYEFLFPVAGYSADEDLVSGLASVVRAAATAAGKPVPSGVREAAVNDAHRSLAAVLGQGQRHAIFLGALAQRHPAYAEIRSLAAALAELSGASLGLVTDGANAAGAYLAGAVPHRESGGAPLAAPGLSARAMLENRLKAYVLFGGIDPATRTFQALRVAVNEELTELERFLDALRGVMAEGGVAAILSFQSMEDRLVKRAFASRGWSRLTKKPQSPSDDRQVLQVVGEIAANAFAAEAIVLIAAEHLQEAYDSVVDGAPTPEAAEAAQLAAAEAKVAVDSFSYATAAKLFDVGGASATQSIYNLDRHWRNVRTISTHNPTFLKSSAIGDNLANGASFPANAYF